MQSYTIGQAARLLGVSPDTARRWADAGRVATHRDDGGRRLIERPDLAAFSVEIAQIGPEDEDAPSPRCVTLFPASSPRSRSATSRRRWKSRRAPTGSSPCSTREAVEELGLEVGMRATARVKSTNVHIDRI